jgi:hypothetical protein
METRYREVHESEWNWAGYPVDIVIENNSDMLSLKENIANIHKDLFKTALKIV